MPPEPVRSQPVLEVANGSQSGFEDAWLDRAIADRFEPGTGFSGRNDQIYDCGVRVLGAVVYFDGEFSGRIAVEENGGRGRPADIAGAVKYFHIDRLVAVEIGPSGVLRQGPGGNVEEARPVRPVDAVIAEGHRVQSARRFRVRGLDGEAHIGVVCVSCPAVDGEPEA